MHRLRRYDVFRFAQNDVAHYVRNDAMFAPMCQKAHTICKANIIQRSRHHLPKANIIQKSLICLVDKLGFFVGARDGTRTHTAKPHAPQTCLSTIPTLSQISLRIILQLGGFVNKKKYGIGSYFRKNTPVSIWNPCILRHLVIY